ncbi:cyclic di-3',5'-guanylate-activated glycosyltransferase NrfB [Oleiagrimonas soli]|uniref:Adsorption protein B n=1 Tax=Oleiagrimonas soli TaxID=1543381 RepID=A0A099CYE7_9GAMM|nr:cyclic di-3',5'-guanylate-activated glycosyltransferase NrfB [Oleiagrimonas soli]KGI78706.1 bacteriophage N4 adsorption protein B [Oleiagrimonas soli]MBB6183963.1 adsorption protein B [Oleiagrimonas soli]
MSLVDVFSTYLFGLSLVVIVVALLMLISGLDDLFIDLVYWVRRGWRSLTVYRRSERMAYQALLAPAEKPLAIMVPAWQETGVIGHMAELAATTLDYENYHIFVGTYPNDEDTQRDVDAVCARFPNVHKVVCARPGPTSKADCLNNVLDAILRFESQARIAFAGFILHDAEDVLSAMELRLFNYLVERKDLIQVPVYPFERQWANFTSLHYLDEFAELHGKDVPVREALAGQVPSAGVGTCFSRRAVLALIEEGNGIAFDVQSLTEDYDIGLRLKQRGMQEIFARFPVFDMNGSQGKVRHFGDSRRESNVICVREYFPDRLSTAVRQKSRWIIGIVYQGYRTHGWTGKPILDYFLWRDRKGALNNFVSFAAMLILLQLAILWLVQALWTDSPKFLSIFTGGWWFHALLLANLLLMANRMLQRVIFVSGYYGLAQGLLSVPRLLWGNLINFLANCRAIAQIIQCGDPRRVAWDKTTHDFPSLGDGRRGLQALEDVLVAQGALSQAQLQHATHHRIDGLHLCSSLIHAGLLRPEQLARPMAEQIGVPCESVDAHAIDEAIIARVPAHIALHYAVLPLRVEGKALVLASESYIDPVSLAALARKLGGPVRYVLAHKGQVTVGLRHWHAHAGDAAAVQTLDQAVRSGRLRREQANALWERYVSRQVMLGEVLVARGCLDEIVLRAMLLNHARSAQRLGDFLVEQGVIDGDTLQHALAVQDALQPQIEDLIDDVCAPPLAQAAGARG